MTNNVKTVRLVRSQEPDPRAPNVNSVQRDGKNVADAFFGESIFGDELLEKDWKIEETTDGVLITFLSPPEREKKLAKSLSKWMKEHHMSPI